MKIRAITFFILLASVTLLAVTRSDAQSYSGRATAIRTTVSGPLINTVTTTVADTGELASGGGTVTVGSVSTNILSGTLTAGTSSSSTSGGGGTSQSTTTVNNLNLTLLGNIIMADAVTTNTQCSCSGGTPSCTGSTTLTNLRLNGGLVTITGSANQTIILNGPLGTQVGTLVINEQIDSFGSKTVNALHVNVTDSVTGVTTDVVIASSHSDILCTTFPVGNLFSGRATGVSSAVDIPNVSTVTTLVADTGPLPSSGGSIGPVTVANSSLPGLLTTGTLTSSTSGSLDSSQSSSSVQDLNATIPTTLGSILVTATVLTSQTQCTCASAGNSTCTGSSQILGLAINAPVGVTVTGTINSSPNNTITFSIGGVVVATIITNEQIPVSPTSTGSITVNALHIMTSDAILNSTTDTVIASSHSDISCGTFTPTAAGVSISGRVVGPAGQPVSRAIVRIIDTTEFVRTSMTNGFGYYHLSEVPAGGSYVMTVSHKLYSFAPRVVNVLDDLANVDFYAEVQPAAGSLNFEKGGDQSIIIPLTPTDPMTW